MPSGVPQWLFVVVLGVIICYLVRGRNLKASLRCPRCGQAFGKRAANGIQPYSKHQTLDGPMMFQPDGCMGLDGFVIHCNHCGGDTIFDSHNKPLTG